MRKGMLIALAMLGLASCNDADIASHNLSKAADNFEINRRVVFINTITGDYLLEIEGLCALGNDDTAQRMSVICKVGPASYKKHFLGLSRNVTFVSQQLEAANVSAYNYKVVFKPSAIVPDISVR